MQLFSEMENLKTFFIGSEINCNRSVPAICNGPLQPGREYQVAYRANNDGRLSNFTEFGGDFSTSAIVATST